MSQDRIRLDNPSACQAELERCSNGLTVLTQEATQVLESLAHYEDQLQQVEAILGRSIRDDSDTSLTATEVNGRIVDLIASDENFSHIRTGVLELRAQKESLERRLRTLEKRGGFAQSALNKHENESRMAGYGGGG